MCLGGGGTTGQHLLAGESSEVFRQSAPAHLAAHARHLDDVAPAPCKCVHSHRPHAALRLVLRDDLWCHAVPALKEGVGGSRCVGGSR